MLTPEMIKELKDLEYANGGLLLTEHVVAKARDPNSALHKHPAFIWDESEAARRYLNDAARKVIMVYATVIDRGDGERRQMRAYATIVDDDKSRAYRATATVLQENRATVINAVLDRCAAHIAKYPLPEFDSLLELIDQIRAEANAPKRASRARRKGGREDRPRPCV